MKFELTTSEGDIAFGVALYYADHLERRSFAVLFFIWSWELSWQG